MVKCAQCEANNFCCDFASALTTSAQITRSPNDFVLIPGIRSYQKERILVGLFFFLYFLLSCWLCLLLTIVMDTSAVFLGNSFFSKINTGLIQVSNFFLDGIPVSFESLFKITLMIILFLLVAHTL